jgi:predicted nucleic acid-binding protein
MPDDRIFIDTNILIYAYDATAGEKHASASNLLIDLWNSRLGVVSTQVLQEFFVNVVQKIPKPIDKRIAKEIVKDLLKWHVVVINGNSILDAIDISSRYRYSFWDAMIIESAIRGNARILMTEDLQNGQKIGGVTIKNPFV